MGGEGLFGQLSEDIPVVVVPIAVEVAMVSVGSVCLLEGPVVVERTVGWLCCTITQHFE